MALADSGGFWRRSPLRLYEDGKLIGPAHALHCRIRAEGRGLYSYWQDQVLFSTSDNSNPNGNGQVYSFDLGDASSERVQADIQRGRGVRERADADYVDASLGDGADVLYGDAAGSFE